MKSSESSFRYPSSQQISVHNVDGSQDSWPTGTRSSVRLPTYYPEDVAHWVSLVDADIKDRGTVQGSNGVGPSEPMPWPDGARLAREEAISDAKKHLDSIARKRQQDPPDATRKGLDASAKILAEALDRWEAEQEKALEETWPVKDSGKVKPPPANLLINWREILNAIDMPNRPENQRRVRKLNDTTGGPINLPSQGGQPNVDRDRLLSWWNGQEERFKEIQQKQADAQATLQDQHNYGREGAVLPNIVGHTKKRRGKNPGK